MFNEIIVAFDGSDHSESALLVACDLAAKYQASLHVIHVPELHKPTAGVAGTPVSVLSQENALHQAGDVIIKRAETLAKETGQPLSSTLLLTGPTAQAMLEVAHTKGADLIVSGRRGLSNLKGMLIGSVSQQLASDAHCAVLTVKAGNVRQQ
jgi:nucleotide-binding universal stress UspA family protein